jgi:hypothetical protein
LHIAVSGQLIAIIGAAADVALRDEVRRDVLQEQSGVGVFVIAARALREELRRDIVAKFGSKLEGMVAMNPG